MTNILVERSYPDSETPKSFYLAFRLTRKAMTSLLNRVFEDCTGISGHSGIYKVEDEYNVQIMMPAQSTIAENKLIRVQYDDLDSLVANDLRVWRRIMATQANYSVKHQVAARLTSFFQKEMAFVSEDQMFSTLIREVQTSPMIQTVEDVFRLAKRVSESGTLLPSSETEWNSMTYEDFRRRLESYTREFVVGIFSHEQEWLLKDRTLRVPKNTIVIQKRNPPIPERSRQELEAAGYVVTEG